MQQRFAPDINERILTIDCTRSMLCLRPWLHEAPGYFSKRRAFPKMGLPITTSQHHIPDMIGVATCNDYFIDFCSGKVSGGARWKPARTEGAEVW